MARQHSSLLLTALLLCLSVHSTQAQISVVNGQSVYSGTPVRTNALGIPTLVYNCAKLPSICNNVNNYGNSGGAGANNFVLTVPPGGTFEKGNLANAQYAVLHIDTSTTRVDARRAQSCPGNWRNTHACPETNQPVVVPEPFNQGGRTVSNGFYGAALNAQTGDYRILDPSGGETGMAWTCDEFPPAFSIEGGQQNGAPATTYCAPQLYVECDGKYTRTEQDFQSSAHGGLKTPGRLAGNDLNYATSIWVSHFLTEFVDNDDAYATRVDWYESNSNFGALYGISEQAQKRAEEAVFHMSEQHYTNGSILRATRQMNLNRRAENQTLPLYDFSAPINDLVKVERRFAPVPDPREEAEKRQASSSGNNCPYTTPAPDADSIIPGGTTLSVTFATVTCSAGAVQTFYGYS